MKIAVFTIGQWKHGPEQTLWDEYTRRLPWQLELHEITPKKSLPDSKRKAEEASLLLSKLPKEAFCIALDERGKSLTSEQFASTIAETQQKARPLAFLIGGADGHGEAVYERADLRLSLGKLTWPHMLVRAMIAEQCYRAYTILNNHPYHRV